MKEARILLIDDEEKIHESFKLIFDREINATDTPKGVKDPLFEGTQEDDLKFKITIDSCKSGDEGIKKFKEAIESKNHYHLVICDMRMPPGKDGKMTLEEISVLAGSKLTAFVCTAFSDYDINEVKSSIKGEKHFLGWIEKPFTAEDVKDMILIRLEMVTIGEPDL